MANWQADKKTEGRLALLSSAAQQTLWRNTFDPDRQPLVRCVHAAQAQLHIIIGKSFGRVGIALVVSQGNRVQRMAHKRFAESAVLFCRQVAQHAISLSLRMIAGDMVI